ncbi:hypothetical protein [Brevibacillus sp. NRS-1366]|uniref:hypothetical protein n=1 Tax=Brevibacillus sp. NRS-1366 TaxID=3233899 RepID=UPI003D1AB9F2
MKKAGAEARPALIDFRSGVPALELFPRKTWGKIVQDVCLDAPADVFGYGRPEGQK